MNIHIGIHILQNFPYSNLNRDESGAPKSTILGGVRRQRVSSQCLKRALRKDPAFRAPLEGHLGERTKLAPELLVERLAESGKIPAEHHSKMRVKAAFFASKKEGKSPKAERGDNRVCTAQQIYWGAREISELAERYEKFYEEDPDLFVLWLDPASVLRDAVLAALGDMSEDPEEKIFAKLLPDKAFMLVDQCLDEFAALGSVDPPANKVSPEGAEWIIRVAQEALETEEQREELLRLLGRKATKGAVSKELKERLKNRQTMLEADLGVSHLSADLALFGRMTTAMPSLVDVEGALSVADAVSTNEMTLEVDYFTAMDDRDDGHHAAHIGEQFGTSNCLYKCAVLSWDSLLSNLKQDKRLALTTLRALLYGAILSLPAAKKRAHAQYVSPDAILIEITGRPNSYVNAFVEPVRGVGEGLVENSIKRLGDHAHRQRTVFNIRGERHWLALNGKALCHVEGDKEVVDVPSKATLDELVSSVVEAVTRLSGDLVRKDGNSA